MQDVEDIVVEPLLRNVAEFSVLVLDSPGGPRASLAQEIQIRTVDEDFIDAELQMERFFARVKVRRSLNCRIPSVGVGVQFCRAAMEAGSWTHACRVVIIKSS